MLATCLSHRTFIMILISSVLNFFSEFYAEEVLNFANDLFFVSTKMIV